MCSIEGFSKCVGAALTELPRQALPSTIVECGCLLRFGGAGPSNGKCHSVRLSKGDSKVLDAPRLAAYAREQGFPSRNSELAILIAQLLFLAFWSRCVVRTPAPILRFEH
jgi:hypothetical protein